MPSFSKVDYRTARFSSTYKDVYVYCRKTETLFKMTDERWPFNYDYLKPVVQVVYSTEEDIVRIFGESYVNCNYHFFLPNF
jgi:hypothetical protein